MTCGSRIGRDAPTAIRPTAPSTRNRRSSSARAPSPRRSRSCLRLAARSSTSRSMSSIRPTGSARCRSTDSGATARRGEIASSTRPSAWSSLRSTLVPKRRASGARGALAIDPTVFRPTLSRPARVAASSLSAASGRPARKRASSPGPSMEPPGAKRAAAQAAPGVEASPARTAKPWWKKRAATSSSSGRSPPNKCAQPLMSRKSPSAPSRATSGV